jgi:rhamnose transport system ATP-binding protein
VEVRGQRLAGGDPRAAIGAGLAYVSEDRHRTGLLLGRPVSENVALPVLGRLSSLGLLRPRRERELARSQTSRMRLVARGVEAAAHELSGGNQQRVVLAKWLSTEPSVLILDEPTRGVDVGAKEEIHQIVDQLAASGVAILLISSDLPELLALSDRVYVMSDGQLTAELTGADATPEAVMRAAIRGTETSALSANAADDDDEPTVKPTVRPTDELASETGSEPANGEDPR